MIASKSLSKLLTSPSKVAQALDWRRSAASVLSLSITRDRIHMAVANHPASSEAQSLPSIPIETEVVDNRRVLAPKVARELASIMQDWQVCGLVVNWPVQEEGWCGAPCGRVLFTLDHLVRDLKNSNRPICLWDEEHRVPDEDEWGRCSLYGEPCSEKKTVHFASEEQYKEKREHAAADIWRDFCAAHWPEIYVQQPAAAASSSAPSPVGGNGRKVPVPRARPSVHADIKTEWLDSYEDTAAYTSAHL